MAVKELKTEEFDAAIASGKTVVEFFTTWCGPCKMMAPVFEELSNEHTDICFARVDAEFEHELAARYKITSVPTFMVFKDGEAVRKSIGALSKSEFEELLRD